jgi:TusA-related sulfurtransferase
VAGRRLPGRGEADEERGRVRVGKGEPKPVQKGVRKTTTGDQINEPMVELDLRGSICPGPTGETLAALKELPPGSKLAVVSDYLPARQTIPRLVEQRGCSWEMTEDDGKTFRMEITKGGE